jgi:hypothetical protein
LSPVLRSDSARRAVVLQDWSCLGLVPWALFDHGNREGLSKSLLGHISGEIVLLGSFNLLVEAEKSPPMAVAFANRLSTLSDFGRYGSCPEWACVLRSLDR